MDQINALLNITVAEIDVAEDPPGSNRVKYNTDYYGREVSGEAYPWCMVFVWWCFREAGLSELFYGGGKTASCTALMRWAKREGQFVTGDYQAGDIVLYQFDTDDKADHTGIYTGTRDGQGRYLVIEGNHGDRVEAVARTDQELLGAYRPKWDEDQSEATDRDTNVPIKNGIDLPEIRYGDQGAPVKAMQILLMGYGYKLPRYGADGEYGSETRTALRTYQLNKGLNIDGICGDRTWEKLLGVSE